MKHIDEIGTRKPGRPVGDHEAKRIELLNAAVSVMAQEGYAGTSLRKVAQRAGHTTGAVTYYFANKGALVIAVAEHLYDQFDSMLIGIEGIKEGVQRWLDTMTGDSDLSLALVQMVSHAKHEPMVATIFQKRYARYRQAFADIIENGQKNGSVRRDIPADMLADVVSATADGWMIARPIEPARFEPRRVARLLDAVMTMISPQ